MLLKALFIEVGKPSLVVVRPSPVQVLFELSAPLRSFDTPLTRTMSRYPPGTYGPSSSKKKKSKNGKSSSSLQKSSQKPSEGKNQGKSSSQKPSASKNTRTSSQKKNTRKSSQKKNTSKSSEKKDTGKSSHSKPAKRSSSGNSDSRYPPGTYFADDEPVHFHRHYYAPQPLRPPLPPRPQNSMDGAVGKYGLKTVFKGGRKALRFCAETGLDLLV